MFEKTRAVLKEIRDRKNREKKRIKKQQAELKDLLPFEAKIMQNLKIINMIDEKTSNLDYITIKTDDKSEALVNEYIETLFSDYIVKQDENDSLLYKFKIKELEL